MKMAKQFIKLLLKIFIIFICVMAAIIIPMLYQTKSQENIAKKSCEKFIIGEVYEKIDSGGNPMYTKNNVLSYYSYLYPLNPDESAECRVYVDKDNKIIKKEFNIR